MGSWKAVGISVERLWKLQKEQTCRINKSEGKSILSHQNYKNRKDNPTCLIKFQTELKESQYLPSGISLKKRCCSKWEFIFKYGFSWSRTCCLMFKGLCFIYIERDVCAGCIGKNRNHEKNASFSLGRRIFRNRQAVYTYSSNMCKELSKQFLIPYTILLGLAF